MSVLVALVLIVALALATSPPAQAGSAATGELLFYPCTSCHPVTGGQASGTLPIDFEGHQVELIVHDRLGEGSAACLICHDDPERDPGKLKLIDGSLVDITDVVPPTKKAPRVNGSSEDSDITGDITGDVTGDITSDITFEIPPDVSAVCYRCHSEKYKEWRSGIHGKREAKCTSAGCHNPHSPSWIYADPLLPFVGTGFQVRTVSEGATFTPLAGPPVEAPVVTPKWLSIASALGALVAVGLLGFVIVGRPKR